MNGAALEAHAKQRLGVDFHETTADGAFTLEPVYCLGNCACSPAMMIDGELYGRVTPERFDELARDWERALMTVDASTSRATPRRCRSAPKRSRGAIAARSARRGDGRHASSATARAACSGSSRSSKCETPAGRVAYGPVTPRDVAGAVRRRLPARRRASRCASGRSKTIPYFAKQERLTFARVGIIDPVEPRRLPGARRLPGPAARARDEPGGHRPGGDRLRPARPRRRGVPDRHQVEDRARRSRPTQKYVTCNADEGDSGTFADRMLMEGDPFALIEGMTIAGARRRRDPGLHLPARRVSARASRAARGDRRGAYARGYLGATSCGSGKRVRPRSAARRRRLHLRRRDVDAREPRRQARRGALRPPLPAIKGLFGKPTVVNNVISLASVPIILEQGRRVLPRLRHGPVARHAADPARAATSSAAASSRRPSASRCASCSTTTAAARASGRPIRAVQVGGPLGAYLPESQFDTPLDYEAFAAIGALLGHGGIVVFDDTVDMAQMARYAMEFCAIESCGKCTPCRIGSTRGVEVIDRIIAGERPRRATSRCSRSCATPCARLAVRAGRHDAVPGAERAEALSGRFRAQTAERATEA